MVIFSMLTLLLSHLSDCCCDCSGILSLLFPVSLGNGYFLNFNEVPQVLSVNKHTIQRLQ